MRRARSSGRARRFQGSETTAHRPRAWRSCPCRRRRDHRWRSPARPRLSCGRDTGEGAEIVREGLGDAARIVDAYRHATQRRSEEHTSELQSRLHLVCRLLLEKKKKKRTTTMAVKQRC